MPLDRRSALAACALTLAGCDDILVVAPEQPTPPGCSVGQPVEFVDVPGSQTVVEGQELVVQLAASAGWLASVEYRMAAAPTGAQLDASTGRFSYRPGFDVSARGKDTAFEIKFFALVGCNRTEDIKVELLVLDDADEDGTPNRSDPDFAD